MNKCGDHNAFWTVSNLLCLSTKPSGEVTIATLIEGKVPLIIASFVTEVTFNKPRK